MRKLLHLQTFITTLTVAFLSLNSAFSQINNIEFEKISIDQGLSQSTVYSIVQDSKGYLWFGTEDGLNRFDGYQFTVFMNSATDNSSISNNRVIAVFEDSKQNLWAGTLGGGLNKFNYQTNSFRRYTHNNTNGNSIPSNVVMSIAEDQKGDLLIGTAGGGLGVYNLEQDLFTNYTQNQTKANSLPGNLVRSIFVNSKGNIFIGTDKGLAIFDKEKETFIHISTIIATENQTLRKTVLSINEDQQSNLWISVEDNGIFRINLDKKTFTHYLNIPNNPNSLASNAVLDIFIDENSLVWLATYEGLQILNSTTDNFITYRSNPQNPYSLSGNLLRCIYEDDSGSMWVGTFRDGANKLNRRFPKFSAIRNLASVSGNLPSSSIRALSEDINGDILVGTFGDGLASINKSNFKISLNPYPTLYSESSTLKYITSIVNDSNYNLWFGTDGGGLYQYNQVTKQFKRFAHNPNDNTSISSNRIRCLQFDSYGSLWVGTTGDGLSKFNPNTKTFTAFKPDSSDPTLSLSQERIICIYEDDRKNIWIGTSSEGLNLYNRETEKFSHFKNIASDSLSISSNRILSIYQDSKKRLWVGTSGGLNLYNFQTKNFKSFRKSHGLPNEVIYGILEDNDGKLWLSSNGGLFSFKYNEGDSLEINAFSKRDGLQSNEFNEGAYFKLSSGKLAFGGIGGVNIFEPTSIKRNPIPPKVHIEKITLFSNIQKTGERKTEAFATYETRNITVPYHQNNLTFQFIALHYNKPQSNKYLYMLKGFDNEWVAPDMGQRFATYTNLRPGTYTFLVKAANSDGVWNEQGASINIVVKSPYWMTWWFIALLTIAFIVLILSVIRYRTASLIRMRKDLEKKVKERTNEILQQKEEIESQRNYLSELNVELQQKNEEIIAQHEELEKAQNHLIQSEKMASIGVLTAGIAHEINNPVNFVYAGVNSIMRDFKDIDHVLQEIMLIDETTTKSVDIIDRILQKKELYQFDEAYKAIEQTLMDVKMGAERTAEIVEGLRNFSRSENESWSNSNINKIIEGVLVLLKNNYKNRIDIDKEFDENLPPVVCKSGRINQVIMNVISNAIDAIVDKGEIKISTKLIDNKCVISIKDNGIGIEDDLLTKIFDPFFTTKKVGKGVGLGLSITYGIILEHNGNIDVNSKVGKGTEFIISLPINQK
jgi:signal transduction histidine kinase/ligand-binding sensor domain-containing protein